MAQLRYAVVAEDANFRPDGKIAATGVGSMFWKPPDIALEVDVKVVFGLVFAPMDVGRSVTFELKVVGGGRVLATKEESDVVPRSGNPYGDRDVVMPISFQARVAGDYWIQIFVDGQEVGYTSLLVRDNAPQAARGEPSRLDGRGALPPRVLRKLAAARGEARKPGKRVPSTSRTRQ
jgi:hypothetical protein